MVLLRSGLYPSGLQKINYLFLIIWRPVALSGTSGEHLQHPKAKPQCHFAPGIIIQVIFDFDKCFENFFFFFLARVSTIKIWYGSFQWIIFFVFFIIQVTETTCGCIGLPRLPVGKPWWLYRVVILIQCHALSMLQHTKPALLIILNQDY